MKIDLLVGFNSGEDLQKNIYNVLEIKDFYENFYKPNDLLLTVLRRRNSLQLMIRGNFYHNIIDFNLSI